MTREKFHGLDLIRGLLCLLVVVWHLNILLPLDMHGASLELAVDIFFALSGFVVAEAYADRLRSGLSPQQFIAMRIVRFYPLYALALAISALTFIPAVLADVANWPAGRLLGYLPQVFMLPAVPAPGNAFFPLNLAAWSLFAELLINIAFAYAVQWRVLNGWVLGAIALICGIGLVILGQRYSGLNEGWRWESWSTLVARVGYAFPMGVLIHKLYHSGFRAPQISGLALLAGLGVVMFDVRTTGPLHTWFEIGFALVLCPALVWIGASVSVGRISVALAQFFGRISYSVYVLHLPVLWFLIALSAPLCVQFGVSPALLAAPMTLAVIAAAWLADVYFDKPINRALTRAFALGKAPDAAPAATIDDPRLAR